MHTHTHEQTHTHTNIHTLPTHPHTELWGQFPLFIGLKSVGIIFLLVNFDTFPCFRGICGAVNTMDPGRRIHGVPDTDVVRCGHNHLDEDLLLWFLGGIEPIPEVSGDGEDLPQEATKFIKKKHSVKKVRKGRNTNSSCPGFKCILLWTVAHLEPLWISHKSVIHLWLMSFTLPLSDLLSAVSSISAHVWVIDTVCSCHVRNCAVSRVWASPWWAGFAPSSSTLTTSSPPICHMPHNTTTGSKRLRCWWTKTLTELSDDVILSCRPAETYKSHSSSHI